MDDQRLLSLPDPAGWSFVHRKFQALRQIDPMRCRNGVRTHDLPGRLVQGQPDKIQFQKRRQAVGKLMEERCKILVGKDGLADFEKRSVMIGL